MPGTLCFYAQQDFGWIELRPLLRLRQPEEVLGLSSSLVLRERVSGAGSALRLFHAVDGQIHTSVAMRKRSLY